MKRTLNFFCVIALAILFAGCGKGNNELAYFPAVSSQDAVIDAATNSIWTGGVVTANGYGVTAYGVCWSKTNPEPSVTDSLKQMAVSSNSFDVQISSVQPGETCYLRAYVSDSYTVAYGKLMCLWILQQPTVP